MMNEQQTALAKQRLLERSEALRLDIQRELRKYEDQPYNELAEFVADSGDQSVADLLSDLNLAEITRDVEELRDVEFALKRLAEGNYNKCIDCGTTIDPQRQEANPAAVRCVECQRAFENRDGEEQYPSL